MNQFFKRLSLPVKLMLIGVVPLIFFIYVSVQLYNERSQKVRLLSSYMNNMQRSADIAMLINNLQVERKYSFEYALKKTMKEEMLKQRPVTDSFMDRMALYKETIGDFTSYTFLENLKNIRTGIDGGFTQANIVMDYYSSSIYRLNTLNSLPTGSNIYLQPVYKDLVSQKLLSEMITFLGIISANIYNTLYTGQYVVETLVGTAGTYRVYKSYEVEFLQKASPATATLFNNIKSKEAVKKADNYLDTVFKKFKHDSTYDHAEWDKISSVGIDERRQLQQTLLKQVQERVNDIYTNEQAARNRTLIFLLISLVFVVTIIVYSIYTITRTLNELKEATRRISLGAPGQPFTDMPNDVIGSLANSISVIDKNNKQLSNAAYAIGKGYFDVPVEPRSPDDILGNAIVEMKANLQKSTSELTASNTELERFAYVASHDLQEPLRMVSSFLHLLEKKLQGTLDESGKQYIDFAVDGAERMKKLIQDLLQYSRVGTNKESVVSVDCNEVMKTVLNVLSLSISETKATINVKSLPVVNGIQSQMVQLFQNLIGNAIKYHSDAAPVIEVGCTDKKELWEFYVKDNGIGIDPKFFDKIFIIFQRLHNKTEYSGTGIGLSICKKIVERHNGVIRVESAPGKGSTFYFTFPKK